MPQKKLMLLGGLRYLLPVIEEAHKLADQVLCLPMFAGLDEESANRVIDVVRNKR